ncbi:MAG TPA: trigger factor [Rhodospirillaceae bacterium]|nr:trigger factor [Candidatus Neomarinimicrobiota bacterium]HCX14079.1 trigger factor [Rhodospirillaceae bacterium]
MQVIDKTADGLDHEFNVVVTAAEIEEKVMIRLTEVGQQVRLPGFRPGKVPMNLLRKRFGQAIRGEVIEKTVEESTQAALTEKALQPAMQPKVDLIQSDEGKNLEFSVQLEVLPTIETPDFSDLELTRLVAKVTDEEFGKTLEGLLKSRRTTETISEDRPAAKGDAVIADYVGQIDGEVFDGGTAEDAIIELGSGTFIPGFEEQLEGSKAGQKVTIKVTFPSDYQNSELAGKAAEFEVKIKELCKLVLPELNDELAKSMGMDDVEAFKARTRDLLQEDYDKASRLRMKRQLLDRLAESYSFDVPKGMVDLEFKAIWDKMDEAAKAGQLELEDAGKSEEELKAEYRGIAERRVRLGLLLSDAGQKNGIEVSPDDLGGAVREEALRYPGQESAVMEFYQNNQQALESLRAPIFEDKVVDHIMSTAKVTDKQVSVEELLSDPDEADTAEMLKSSKNGKTKKSK